MSLLARITTFMPGTPILSTPVNQEFNQLVNTLNGTLTNKNLLVRYSNASDPPLDLDQLGAGVIARYKAAGVEVAKVTNDGSFQTVQSFVSTLAGGGVAPITVASNTLCVNLNADLIDGLQGADLVRKSDTSNQVIVSDLAISKNTPELVWLDDGGGQVRINNNGTSWDFIDDAAGVTPLSIALATGIPTFNVIPRVTANPSNGNELARKTYVDLFLPLAGGTLTGGLTISSGNLSVAGTISGDKVVSVIGQVVNDVANSGSGETDLNSITIPANTLANDGDMLFVETGGGWSSNNSKTLRYYIGGTAMHAISQTTVGNPEWSARLKIVRISSNTVFHQIHTSGLLFNIAGVGNIDRLTDDDRGTTGSLNFANAITFKVTGQGTGGGQVSCQFITMMKGDGA